MSLPDRWPCVRTISTAADSRFRSEANVSDTSVNAGGHVSGMSAVLSSLTLRLSDTLSGLAPTEAPVSGVGLRCPVNAWVQPDTCSEWDRVSDPSLSMASDICPAEATNV